MADRKKTKGKSTFFLFVWIRRITHRITPYCYILYICINVAFFYKYIMHMEYTHIYATVFMCELVYVCMYVCT